MVREKNFCEPVCAWFLLPPQTILQPVGGPHGDKARRQEKGYGNDFGAWTLDRDSFWDANQDERIKDIAV